MRTPPIPVDRMHSPDIILSRPSVNRALAERVLHRRWTLFHGTSASGKTLSMHYFIRNQLRMDSADDDTDMIYESTWSSLKVPITCHLQVRNCTEFQSCLAAFSSSLGLRMILKGAFKLFWPLWILVLASSKSRIIVHCDWGIDRSQTGSHHERHGWSIVPSIHQAVHRHWTIVQPSSCSAVILDRGHPFVRPEICAAVDGRTDRYALLFCISYHHDHLGAQWGVHRAP